MKTMCLCVAKKAKAETAEFGIDYLRRFTTTNPHKSMLFPPLVEANQNAPI